MTDQYDLVRVGVADGTRPRRALAPLAVSTHLKPPNVRQQAAARRQAHGRVLEDVAVDAHVLHVCRFEDQRRRCTRRVQASRAQKARPVALAVVVDFQVRQKHHQVPVLIAQSLYHTRCVRVGEGGHPCDKCLVVVVVGRVQIILNRFGVDRNRLYGPNTCASRSRGTGDGEDTVDRARQDEAQRACSTVVVAGPERALRSEITSVAAVSRNLLCRQRNRARVAVPSYRTVAVASLQQVRAFVRHAEKVFAAGRERQQLHGLLRSAHRRHNSYRRCTSSITTRRFEVTRPVHLHLTMCERDREEAVVSLVNCHCSDCSIDRDLRDQGSRRCQHLQLQLLLRLRRALRLCLPHSFQRGRTAVYAEAVPVAACREQQVVLRTRHQHTIVCVFFGGRIGEKAGDDGTVRELGVCAVLERHFTHFLLIQLMFLCLIYYFYYN